MSKLIYLSGKARSGKDEFARLWIKNNPKFIRMAFADEIKSMTSQILGVKLEDLSNPETKEKYRAFLIYGGQLVRAIDPDYWVKKVTSREDFKRKDVIITDVRCVNEMEELEYRAEYYFKEAIGVRISALEPVRLARGANPDFFDDVSETSMDNEHLTWNIANNGTLEDLEKEIKKVMAWHG